MILDSVFGILVFSICAAEEFLGKLETRGELESPVILNNGYVRFRYRFSGNENDR